MHHDKIIIGSMNGCVHWGIALNENDKVIGEAWIYLIEKNRMAKIAFRIAPAYQGKGFATEATKATIDFCFTHTELQRIWEDVDIRNIASWKVLKSVFLNVGV